MIKFNDIVECKFEKDKANYNLSSKVEGYIYSFILETIERQY